LCRDSCVVSGWEERRIVYTKDEICIAFVGEDTVRDMVPLAEVLAVEELGSDYVKDISDPRRTHTSISSTIPGSKLFHARSIHGIHHVATTIKLVTKEKGYNSGRTYYLQPKMQQESEHLVQELVRLTDIARKKAEGKTRFHNSQACTTHATRFIELSQQRQAICM
jgi:hypothetical protein